MDKTASTTQNSLTRNADTAKDETLGSTAAALRGRFPQDCLRWQIPAVLPPMGLNFGGFFNLLAPWSQHQHSVQFSSVAQSCPTLRPHELQHAGPPCPSPAPRVHPNSCPSSRWCHPAISSSVVPFFSCPQSFPPTLHPPQIFSATWIFWLLPRPFVELSYFMILFIEIGLFSWLTGQMLRCQGLQQRKSLFTGHPSEEMRERKERKWSRSVVSDFLRPHGLYQASSSMGFSRQE